MPDDDAVTLRSADVVAFVGELILLGVLAVAGFRLGYGILAVVLAIALPTLMGVLWG